MGALRTLLRPVWLAVPFDRTTPPLLIPGKTEAEARRKAARHFGTLIFDVTLQPYWLLYKAG